MPGGRPTIFSDEIGEAICLRIIEGESLRSICADHSMPSMAAVFKWLASGKYPEFVEQYSHARACQGDLMDDLILETAHACTPETAAADRVKISAYQWRAGKLRPKVYGDKIQQEVTGANGAPLPVVVYIPDNGRDKSQEE